MYDNEALTSPTDDFDPLTGDQCAAARRTVAHTAARLGLGVTEATEVMLALGIYPGQEVDDELTNVPSLITVPSTPPRRLKTTPRLVRPKGPLR